MAVTAHECKRLKKRLQVVEKIRMDIKEDITVDNTKTNGGEQACFMIEEYNPIVDRECIIFRDDFVPSHTIYECPSMYSCQNSKCPYFSEHKKYIQLENEAEYIQNILNKIPFWIKVKSLFVHAR